MAEIEERYYKPCNLNHMSIFAFNVLCGVQLINLILCNERDEGALGIDLVEVQAFHGEILWGAPKEDQEPQVKTAKPELEVNLS